MPITKQTYKSQHQQQQNYKNLFIAKLEQHIADADLMEIFAAHKPVSATVMLDAVTGRSKGFGFVLFETAEAGKAAEQALNKQPVSVGGQVFDLTIFPSKHVGTIAAEECECLFIRNIPNTWSMAEVDAFIARHGTPVYSAVRSDHHGSPVWVVFVEYDSVESARNTLRNIHGQRVGGDNHPAILAKFAESEEVKRARRSQKTAVVDTTTSEESTIIPVAPLKGLKNAKRKEANARKASKQAKGHNPVAPGPPSPMFLTTKSASVRSTQSCSELGQTESSERDNGSPLTRSPNSVLPISCPAEKFDSGAIMDTTSSHSHLACGINDAVRNIGVSDPTARTFTYALSASASPFVPSPISPVDQGKNLVRHNPYSLTNVFV